MFCMILAENPDDKSDNCPAALRFDFAAWARLMQAPPDMGGSPAPELCSNLPELSHYKKQYKNKVLI